MRSKKTAIAPVRDAEGSVFKRSQKLCPDGGNISASYCRPTTATEEATTGAFHMTNLWLLSTTGQILAKILLKRLQTIAELILPESQCGFRTSRFTINMIFTLRQLQEKAFDQQQSLYMVFIDLSKAGDTVDRSTLWILLRRYGCPEIFVKLVQEFHDGMAGSVSVGGTITYPFEISHGLKQGCVFAPTLFTLFLGAVLSAVSEHLSIGVFIRTRTDGQQ